MTFSVPDVDDAIRFYMDVLGCRLVARWPAGAYLLAGHAVPGDDMGDGEVRWAGVAEIESAEVPISVPTDTALFGRALAVVDVGGEA